MYITDFLQVFLRFISGETLKTLVVFGYIEIEVNATGEFFLRSLTVN